MGSPQRRGLGRQDEPGRNARDDCRAATAAWHAERTNRLGRDFIEDRSGIDKFMSECRALTNLVGNGVATVVISRWEGELDTDKLHEAMAHSVALGEEMETKSL